MSPTISHEPSDPRRDSSVMSSICKVSTTIAWPHIHGDRKPATMTDNPHPSSGLSSGTDAHRTQSSLSYTRGLFGHKRSEAVDLREPASRRSKRPLPTLEDGDNVSGHTHSCLSCNESKVQAFSPMPSPTKPPSTLSTYASVAAVSSTQARRRSSTMTMDMRDVLHNGPLPVSEEDTSRMNYPSPTSTPCSSTSRSITPLTSKPITHVIPFCTTPPRQRPRRNSNIPEIKCQASLSTSNARLAPSGLVPNKDLDSWSCLWDEAYEHKDDKAPKRKASFRSALRWKHSKSDLGADVKKTEDKQHNKSDTKPHAKDCEKTEERIHENNLWEQARQRRAALDYQVVHKCGNSSGISTSISAAPSSIASSQPASTLSLALSSPTILEDCSCDTSSVLYGQEGKLGCIRRKGFVERWVLSIKEACCQDDGAETLMGEEQAPHPIHHV